MLTTIINLLLINVIVALVYMSGFWDTMDYYVNKHFKFHHLPHIFQCYLCQTMWLSVIYILIAGKLSLLWLAMCLVNAHLTEVMVPLLTVVKNWLLKVVKWVMPK